MKIGTSFRLSFVLLFKNKENVNLYLFIRFYNMGLFEHIL